MSHRTVGMLLAGMALPNLGLLLFSATGRDDSHITFWVADALAQTGSIVNYNGASVEQSSSLLHTLVLAVVSATGFTSTPTAALALGAFAGAASVVLAWRLGEDLRPGAGWIGGMLAATSAYLAYWSLSGLETSLVALAATATAVTGGRYLADGRAPLAAMLSAAAWVLVRPEGALVVLAALVGATVLAPRSWRRAGVLGVATAIVFLAVTNVRLLLFGLPFPQPVMAKIGGLGVAEGAAYVQQWFTPALALMALAAVAGAVLGRRPAAALAVAIVAAQVGFVVTSGGDWMEGGRMLVPVLPVLAALAAAGIRRLPAAPVVAAIVIVANVGSVASFARHHSTGQPLWIDTPADSQWAWPELANRIHRRDAAFLPEFNAILAAVDAGMKRPVLYASAQGGMVPYHSLGGEDRNVRFIDRWALTTRRAAACNDHAEAPTAYGRELTYAAWAAATDDCGRLPDVVVELGSVNALPPGYTVVHTEPPVPPAPSSLLPGRVLSAGEFVAVRDKLVPLIRDG